MKGKIIQPCINKSGHFWRPIDNINSQCARCGECSTREDFLATTNASDHAEYMENNDVEQ